MSNPVESIPYPFGPVHAEGLRDSQRVSDVRPLVISRSLGRGVFYPVFVVALDGQDIAIAERDERDGYVVLERGSDAYEAANVWADAKGYEGSL